MATKKSKAVRPKPLSGEDISELCAKAKAFRQRFLEKPENELTRAIALGTWVSFFGDYSVCRVDVEQDYYQELLRSEQAANHKAACDYLIRLAHDNGIKDAATLHHAGELCRLLAKQQELRDPDAESHLWPTCLGKNRCDLPKAQQEVIEAGEQVIQQLRLKLFPTVRHDAETHKPNWQFPQSLEIVVSHNPPQVTVNGLAYAVNDAAATLVQAVVDAQGDWISGSSIVNQPSRVVATMPENVRKLVEPSPGKGFRLRREQ